MGDIIGYLIGLLIIAVIILFPLSKVLRRMGYSGWWAIVFLIPFGALIGLWVLAFAKWPNLRETS
jgi:H+/Cl- antiporter ClcA